MSFNLLVKDYSLLIKHTRYEEVPGLDTFFEFVSMAKVYVPLEKLLDVRERLVQDIKNVLTQNDKKFLISFVSNKPDWSLVRDDKIKEFPSVKWKVFNQEKLELKDKGKHSKYVDSLKNVLKS